MKKRLIVGVTGASGAPLAWDCLRELDRHPEFEVHLILTPDAETTIALESPHSVSEFRALAHRAYSCAETAAGPASGTFAAEGMLIVPCSMKTAAGICAGYAENLLLRAADVTLKEGRRLVLCPRETPLSPIHLRNLGELARLPGVAVVPPVLSYYNRPDSIADMEHHITAKLLSFFGIETEGFRRWDNDAI